MNDADITDHPRPLSRDAMLDELHKTGPGTLGGIFLRQFWIPVARSEDIPAGRATKIRVLSEDFTLYRGEGGTAHITAHRCPHRGTQLSVGYVEGDAIRCIYHGWKFAGDGKCVERPGEIPGGEAKCGIGAYDTREFLGLVFGYFGPGEPPAFPPFPAFNGEGIVENYRGHFTCNYLQGWENTFDIYHARYTHATGQLHLIDYDQMIQTETFAETEYGILHQFEPFADQIFVEAQVLPFTVCLMIPTFNEQRRQGGGPQFRQTYICMVPIDDTHYMPFITQQVPVTGAEAEEYAKTHAVAMKARVGATPPINVANEILNSTASIQDFKNHPILVACEDTVAQVGQGTIVDRHSEKLGRTDAGIIAMRRILARELQAISDGRPSKNWQPLAEIPVGTFGKSDA